MQHMPIQITAVPKAFAPNGEITFCLKKTKTYHTYEEIIIVNMLQYNFALTGYSSVMHVHLATA